MIGRIFEMFVSVQGEGIHAGEQMLFVRFCGCNLNCDYCDTEECRYAISGRLLTHEEIMREIEDMLAQNPYVKTVSFTGGEPLLQAELIAKLIEYLKEKKMKIYVDTNGTLYDKFAAIASSVDCVAMDIKLPSASGGKELWEEHKKFLLSACENIFVKIVLTSKTTVDEFKKAVEMVERVNNLIPFVMQPVTPIKEVDGILPENLERFKKIAEKRLKKVSIIPQMHKKWGIK